MAILRPHDHFPFMLVDVRLLVRNGQFCSPLKVSKLPYSTRPYPSAR
jgi:hypothetical protein